MDEERFWAVIDAFDWAHEGDDDAVLRPATEALTAMPSEEIQACVVVANGRAFYEAVLAEPSRMPGELEFEALPWLAVGAHIAKTGAETPSLTPVSWESFSNLEGWRPNQYTRPGSATSDRVPPMNRRPASQLSTLDGVGS